MVFTHSRDISNYTGAPLLSALCPVCLLGGLLSMWRSHWRKCQLNLRSLHTAVHLLSTVTRDLQQQGGLACLVTFSALWHCGWCATRSALCTLSGPGSDYRPRRRGTEHGSNRIRLSTQAWEMCSWIDRFYSRQETQICRCWAAGRHQKLLHGK